MKPYRRAVAGVGKYTNREGQEKTRYVSVGTLFKGEGEDEGRFSLKLDATPAGNDWNGWVSFFEIEDRREGQQPRGGGGGGDYGAASGQRGSAPRESFAADLDDDIPFVRSNSIW